MIKRCLRCDIEFKSKPSSPQKFCCKQCYTKYQTGKPGTKPKTGIVKKCLHCGIEFYIQNWERERKYCSAICGNIHKRGRPNPKILTEEDRYKLRMKVIKQKQISIPFYNKMACDYFDKLNKDFNWDGRHAENGGEKRIRGYFVDYYEPTLNLIIEWNEPHHYQEGKLKDRDINRQIEIEKHSNCRMLQINASEINNYIDFKTKIYECIN